MYVSLTPAVARELGKTLKFLRHGGNLTLADVGKRAGLSLGYVQNIESGARINAREVNFLQLAKGYQVPDDVMADLVMRSRILAALDRRGLTGEQAAFIWRGIEARLGEVGFHPQTDIAKIITGMLAPR